MIERGGVPARRRMASGAICRRKRRARRGVHRIVRLLPVRQMALRVSTIGRRNRQRIVVIDVAQIAGNVCVSIRQREARGVVIENSRGPGCNRMARRASGSRRRETRRDVIRNIPANRRRALECGLVATVTIRRIQRVIVIDMAGRAGGRSWGHVRSRQGKPRAAVVKRGRVPTHRGVTQGAIRGCKSWAGGGVHRIIRLLPRRQVTLRISAIRRCDGQCVVVIDVAGSASHAGMAVGQREPRRAVVKRRRRPAHSCVAGGAIRCCERRPGGRVHGIVRLLPGRQMAL